MLEVDTGTASNLEHAAVDWGVHTIYGCRRPLRGLAFHVGGDLLSAVGAGLLLHFLVLLWVGDRFLRGISS